MEFADSEDRAVTVCFEKVGVSVVLNEAMVGKLAASSCKILYVYNNEEFFGLNGALGNISVGFADASGNPVTVGGAITLRLSLDGKASAYTKAYSVTDAGASIVPLACTYENGEVTVKLAEGASVVLRNEYKVSAGTVENGVISIDKQNALAGETIKASLTYSDAYCIVYFKVVGVDSGNEYELSEDGSFTMPEESVTVTAELKVKEYTVKFVVDGNVISEIIYHKGDTVDVPEDPTKEREGDTVYTFIGWSPAITIVSEDVTYTAEFSSAVIGGDPVVNTDRTRLYTVIALGIAAVLLVVVGIPVATILIVKRRKKKKAKASEKKSEDKSEE
jgi:hypothetical protein